MHVHHARRGAVLWSRQLGAVLLIFALLLVLVLLKMQDKWCQKHNIRVSWMQPGDPKHSIKHLESYVVFVVVTCHFECLSVVQKPQALKSDREILQGVRTHIIGFGLRHWHPLVDTQRRVSNSHPFLFPAKEQKPR